MIVAVIEKKGLEPENKLPVLNTEFSVLISNLATGHLLPEWKGLVPENKSNINFQFLSRIWRPDTYFLNGKDSYLKTNQI